MKNRRYEHDVSDACFDFVRDFFALLEEGSSSTTSKGRFGGGGAGIIGMAANATGAG